MEKEMVNAICVMNLVQCTLRCDMVIISTFFYSFEGNIPRFGRRIIAILLKKGQLKSKFEDVLDSQISRDKAMLFNSCFE